jgi:hypothetical protein
MIKPAFNIAQGDAPESLEGSTLVVELSEKQLTLAWVDKLNKNLLYLRQYHLAAESEETSMAGILQELTDNDDLFQKQIGETVVVYNYADTTLLPEAHYSIELGKPVMELTTGNVHKGLVLSEKVNGRQFYTVYRIPRDVHSLLQRKFSAGKYWHYYSLLLSNLSGMEGVVMRVNFYPDKFVVAVTSGEEVQLIQTFGYQLPEDVAYYLLLVCRQLNHEPTQVRLMLSGLVDADSVLYNELYRYFTDIVWDTSGTAAWNNEMLNEFPAHYFSPLLQLALCV